MIRYSNMSAEHRLMYDLLTGYEKSIRPVINSSQAVDIKLGLALTQILDLVSICNNERLISQIITIYTYHR